MGSIAGGITDFVTAAAVGEISALTIVPTADVAAETAVEINAIAATIVVTVAQINVETAGAEVIVDAEIIVVTDRVREHSFIFYRLGGFPALPDPPFSCNELLSQNLLDECNKYHLFLCILSYL